MSKTHLLVISILTIVSLSPLFRDGFYTSSDGENHLIRIARFSSLLAGGNLYPRWDPVLNHGRGYPLFNFTYPLPYFVSSLFHFTNLSVVDSLKATFVLFTGASVLFFYLWTRHLPATVLFLFTPYRFVNLYVRAALGEVAFLGILPLCFLCIDKKNHLLLVISLSLLIFSHLQLSLIFIPIMFLYALVNRFEKGYIASLFLSLLVSSIFWLPATYLTGFTKYFSFHQFIPSQHLPTFRQLVYSPWGFGFSRPGLADDISFQLGLAAWAVLIISSLNISHLKSSRKLALVTVWSSLIFMSTNLFGLWDWPIIQSVQFSWRLLMISLVFTPYVFSGLNTPKLFSVFVIALAIYANRNHIRTNLPQFVSTPDSFFITSQQTATSTPDEFMPQAFNASTSYLFSSSPVIIISQSLSLLAVVLYGIIFSNYYRHQ